MRKTGMAATSETGIVQQLPILYDRWLLLAIFSLLAFGVLMVASSSMAISERQFGTPFHYLIRQGVFLLAGLVLMAAVFRVPIRVWRSVAPFLLLATFILLVLVLIPGLGRRVNGSARWLGISFFGIQVSEVAKLFIFIYLASYLQRHQQAVKQQIMGFLKPMFIITVVVFLLLLEPDFGASVVILVTALGMMFLAGIRLRYFLGLSLLVVLALSILAYSSPYRLQRLTSFLDPWANQFGSGYQLTQSLIAFGQGGWFGVGLGDSVQKLFYLPEAHTDFLFAVLAEELGLVGLLAVLTLFIILIWRALRIGYKACAETHLFAGFLAYGFALWIACQVIINMGVNMGVLPTKGLTLPLMSYGGSSLLINCIMLGILLRIDHESRLLWRRR